MDLRDAISNDIRDFFGRLTGEGIHKLFEALYKKGHLLKDNEGWYKLRDEQAFTQIAIVGKITAGHLREAVSDPLGYVQFNGSLQLPEQLFAFQVEGDSMIGDHIEDGDCVLLRNTDVLDGQIGAVIVNGETTLKRIYRDSGMLRLVPSNPRYDTIHIFASDMDYCRILGRLEATISYQSGEVTWFAQRNAVTELTLYMN